LLSSHPWLGEVVLPLRNVVPARSENAWALLDAHQRSLVARTSDDCGWHMMALSGGHPIEIVGSFDGDAIRPMAAAAAGDYVLLTANALAGDRGM
jgi:hypothetical protein